MVKLPQILCIDSEEKNLYKTQSHLKEQGYEVLFADFSTDLFAQAEHHLPDVIIVDISGSHINTLSLLKQIRSNKKTKYIPVMVIMPAENTGQKNHILDMGCDDFLSSPVDSSELASRLRLLIKLSHYRKQLSAKEKFEAVIRQMGDSIIICDMDWTLQRANSAADKQLNLSGNLHKSVIDYMYDNFSVSIEKEQLISSKASTLHFDIARKETKNTKDLFLEATRDLITSLGGEVTGILLTLRDVTGKKKEELLKHNFLSFISHKLKTPLTVLFARCDLIRTGVFGKLNSKQLLEMNSLMTEIRNLRALFNRLVNFVEHHADEPEKIVLPEYIETFFRRFINTYPYKKIEVKTDISDEKLSVFLSGRKVNDIFENLTENAVKFNDNESIIITVTAAAASDGFINISFSDNGNGIPSEEYGKIFDKFYQVEKHFTGELKGVGLGLSHIKQIIEECGGTIKVESRIGSGTTFMFRLPQAEFALKRE